VDMAYTVFQLALEEGVQRVVMASSNHAADWYELLIHARQKDVPVHGVAVTRERAARRGSADRVGWRRRRR
jgi:hypothetical protein